MCVLVDLADNPRLSLGDCKQMHECSLCKSFGVVSLRLASGFGEIHLPS